MMYTKYTFYREKAVLCGYTETRFHVAGIHMGWIYSYLPSLDLPIFLTRPQARGITTQGARGPWVIQTPTIIVLHSICAPSPRAPTSNSCTGSAIASSHQLPHQRPSRLLNATSRNSLRIRTLEGQASPSIHCLSLHSCQFRPNSRTATAPSRRKAKTLIFFSLFVLSHARTPPR
ncbi:hypothetical protein LX36DRAFT_346728 [Colletotrichum falcatum]|nr:hypothetical protein LX36DRAFT_346728 [Colletotrichum falcatum]